MPDDDPVTTATLPSKRPAMNQLAFLDARLLCDFADDVRDPEDVFEDLLPARDVELLLRCALRVLLPAGALPSFSRKISFAFSSVRLRSAERFLPPRFS